MFLLNQYNSDWPILIVPLLSPPASWRPPGPRLAGPSSRSVAT